MNNVNMEAKEQIGDLFEIFLKETDKYIEKIKVGTETENDATNLFLLDSGDPGDSGYKRILVRASRYHPMCDDYSLDRILTFRNLVHLNKDCLRAEVEWNKSGDVQIKKDQK